MGYRQIIKRCSQTCHKLYTAAYYPARSGKRDVPRVTPLICAL